MNAILLAAGYGTRLYPLTRHKAKPLLPVGGRPIIDYLAERLDQDPEVERLILVSNARFFEDFRDWASSRDFHTPLLILNDGSTCNEDRLGAVADIGFALQQGGAGQGPVYVLATDNLPRFDLTGIIDAWRRRGTSAVFACPEENHDRLRRSGVAQLDEDGRLVSFEEKPDEPKGHYRVPPFYIYTAEAVASLPDYLAAGNNPDAPGYLLAWWVSRATVYGLPRPEGTWDIGTLESYRAVRREFEEQSG